MAAGGSSTSMLGASDEVFDLLCEICQSKGKEREAKHFCENCNSYICESCKTIHSRIPDLRQHKTSPAMIQNDCGLCMKEGNKIKADHFCKMCKFYICSVCMDAHGMFDALKHHIIVPGKSMLRRHDPSASDDVSNKFSHLSTSEMTNCPADSSLKSNKQNESRILPQKSLKPAERVDEARSSTAVPSTGISVQTQTKSLADMAVRTLNKINIGHENDTFVPWITGCCFMPGGELVLCDFNNCKIKVLNMCLTLQCSLALQGAPWDVADLDCMNIVVTLPDIQQVQVIQLRPTVMFGRIISFDIPFCRWTDLRLRNKEVIVYDISWNLIRILGVDQYGTGLFRQLQYIAVSQTSGSVFVSDYDTHTVTCLSSDNKVEGLYNGGGSLRDPRGLYVDSHDNLILCNYCNDSLDIITAGSGRILLSSRDGILNPYCVTFTPDDQTLVVGVWNKDIFFVYKFS